MTELNLGWPQWVAITWYALTFVAAMVIDGQQRTGTYNGALIIIVNAVWIGVLYAGGFWT